MTHLIVVLAVCELLRPTGRCQRAARLLVDWPSILSNDHLATGCYEGRAGDKSVRYAWQTIMDQTQGHPSTVHQAPAQDPSVSCVSVIEGAFQHGHDFDDT